MPIDINQLENMLKPSVLGWINQAISAAALSGITVTLPENVAYLDVAQLFTEAQSIYKENTDNNNTDLFGFGSTFGANMSGNDTGSRTGVLGIGFVVSGNTKGLTLLQGVQAVAAHYGSGTVTTAEGSLNVAQNQLGGVVSAAAGASFGVENLGAGTITQSYGAYVRGLVVSAGTVTTATGILVSEQTGATNNSNVVIGQSAGQVGTYSIYNASTRANYFAGRLGIGAEDAAKQLFVYKSYTTTPTDALAEAQAVLLSAADTSGNIYGLKGTFATDNSDVHNHTGSFIGVYGFADHTGAGTVNLLRGVLGDVRNDGAGTVTSASGLRVTIFNTGVGKITSAFGLNISNPTVSAGTITAAAGIVVENFTTALKNTNLLIGNGGTVPTDQNWSIYNASTYANFIGGSVTVDNRLTLKQISKPSSPAANYNSIYPKSDNNWYGLTSGGVETQLGGSGSAGTATDVQIFATPGTATWNEPTGAKWTSSMVVGGGGGGGGGRVGATAGGGAGGSGGGVSMDWWPASVMGTAETVITGAGGGGGLGTTSGNGNDGTAGADSKFGNWIAARGGALGAGGNNATAAGGAGGAGLLATGGGGGAGSVTAGGPGSSSVMGGGGGGGGGGNTGPGAGGAGGQGATLGQSPAVGAAGSSPAGVGGTGTASTANSGEGGSGGGGGGGRTTAGTAGAGGPGGKYGGGGGGGGGATTGSTSGAGGAGADGIVIVITTF